MKYIKNLDGVRALAVLLVVASHTGFGNIVPGGFGVTTFFCLSGFLITQILLREYDLEGMIDYRSFVMRRALRIFIPFYVVYFTLIIFASIGWYPDEFTVRGVFSQLFFLTNYFVILEGKSEIVEGTKILWSLAVEEHFYILFPLLASGCLRLSPQSFFRVLMAICAAVLAWRYSLWFSGSSLDRIDLATDTRIDSIIYGCLLAIHLHQQKLKSTQTVFSISEAVVIVVALLLLFATFAIRDQSFANTLKYTLQGLGLVILLRGIVLFPDQYIFRLLEWKPVKLVGVFSYVIYLVHLPVIVKLKEWGVAPGALLFMSAFSISVGLGWGFYHTVEHWARELKKRKF